MRPLVCLPLPCFCTVRSAHVWICYGQAQMLVTDKQAQQKANHDKKA